MWSPCVSAYYGGGGANEIPNTEKLGGFVVQQFSGADLETPCIDKNFFNNVHVARTMTEVVGSDLMGFSDGGFIWASEATCNILCPAANLVGAYYKGTVQYG